MEILYNALTGKSIHNDEQSYEVDCGNCGSKFRVQHKELTVGCYGFYYCNCPVCEKRLLIEDAGEESITYDNIQYPNHFDLTSNEPNNRCNSTAVELSDKDIADMVKDVASYLKTTDASIDYCVSRRGNVVIIGVKSLGDGENAIYVAKNYEMAYIDT